MTIGEKIEQWIYNGGTIEVGRAPSGTRISVKLISPQWMLAAPVYAYSFSDTLEQAFENAFRNWLREYGREQRTV
jgi:hypothetical protein